MVVGETNRYNLDLNLAGVIPPHFAALSGTATKVVASLKLPTGVEIDPATATVTGVDGATVKISGDQVDVNVPGPVPFGAGAKLPSLTVSIDVKATQAGTVVLTTEGATALLEAEAALTPDTDPIPVKATCVNGAPETLLTVSVTDVAGATQTAAKIQTSSATATASPGAMATTGSESVVLSGVALLLMGFGMLAVAGQRSLAHRRS